MNRMKVLSGLVLACLVFAGSMPCWAQEAAPEGVAPGVNVIAVGEKRQNNENWAGMVCDEQGRVYLTGGDHEPRNWAKKQTPGNSWVFRFDPADASVTTILDIKANSGKLYREASIGHGKFHVSPLMDSAGTIWISSYYYNKEYLDTSHYDGSILFSIHPGKEKEVVCHGIIFPREGTMAAQLVPSIGAYAALTAPSGRLQVYSLKEKKVIFASKAKGGINVRLLAKDSRDRLYFHNEAGRVIRWDPKDNSESSVNMLLPSARSLPPRQTSDAHKEKKKNDLIRMMKITPDGTFVGVTNYGYFFRYDPEREKTSMIGPALELNGRPAHYYVPDFALSSDGAMLYYTGGLSNQNQGVVHDNPVIAWNLKSGKKRILCRLNQVLKKPGFGRFRYNFGALLSRDEKTLYLCPNIAPGRVCLVAILTAR